MVIGAFCVNSFGPDPLSKSAVQAGHLVARHGSRISMPWHLRFHRRTTGQVGKHDLANPRIQLAEAFGAVGSVESSVLARGRVGSRGVPLAAIAISN